MSVSLLLLEFPGTAVAGDCTISGFEGHIAIDSFSWDSIKADTKKDKSGKTITSVKFGKLRVAKTFDCASIPMCNMMDSEAKFGKAVLRFIDPAGNSARFGGKPSKFEPIMEMEMIDGYIESISTRASESSKAMSVSEDVMLSFHEVNLTYYAYDPAKSLRVAMPSFQSVQADF